MSEDPSFYLDQADPAAWKALNGVSQQVADSLAAAGLTRAVVELINVRVSQLNGCAFCLDMHVKLARRAGVTDRQLAVLTVWKETELFDDVECAALTVAEIATELPDQITRRSRLEAAREVLTDAQFSAVQWAALTIGTFNRLSILSEYPVQERALDRKKKAEARHD
ncbi:carboxymuconolactone decarboxylase family protein [Kocuria sp. p3-SID1433]|uniref:carboxymuconolactone decarboxylase family protein n=1 Tax=unclassified Kocuria TaxID=2649579 RepID=UPI0021A604AA|nr:MULTISPECIES: carboxymuconolactone decarboxylase family protein [unclassified Kocuria]MCT1601597.1 carboxymuconolactone decarboxylase family protein [Kocuria sp. p3-SID1428]MCT2179498.1 carboxymuconolactone decarboxylase family protein [Kocuria sp. p3-SID1433]